MEEKARQAKEKRERVERALAMNQKKIDDKRVQLAQQMEMQFRQMENFADHLQTNYSDIQKQKRVWIHTGLAEDVRFLQEADLKRKKAKEEADRGRPSA